MEEIIAIKVTSAEKQQNMALIFGEIAKGTSVQVIGQDSKPSSIIHTHEPLLHLFENGTRIKVGQYEYAIVSEFYADPKLIPNPKQEPFIQTLTLGTKFSKDGIVGAVIEEMTVEFIGDINVVLRKDTKLQQIDSIIQLVLNEATNCVVHYGLPFSEPTVISNDAQGEFKMNFISNASDRQDELNMKLIRNASKGKLEKVKLLLEKVCLTEGQQPEKACFLRADIHADRDDPLHKSVQNGHYEVVKYLLEKGADIHACYDLALRRSAKEGHYEIVKLLLEKGANIHAENDEPLRESAEEGHYEVVKLLLEKGADLHADNDDALRWSAKKGHYEVVKLLLEKGADLHADNDYALRESADNGHLKVVELLIKKGANVNADNDDALRGSHRSGHYEIVNLLLKNGANKSALGWTSGCPII